MCGGLARWLRALGYDAAYTEGIDDGELVEFALREGRILISSDGRLFERRRITSRQVRALRLPRGLQRFEQLDYVVRALRLAVLDPRCMRCGGRLDAVQREDVADVVPARSLLFADAFYRCQTCRHVYWNGSHWQRITGIRDRFKATASDPADDHVTLLGDHNSQPDA